ncbi:MAG: sugar ABC transporter permease [Bacteroidetes bacterium]|nr:sugar ABC transporter permease [Bacteroidota bacterium]
MNLHAKYKHRNYLGLLYISPWIIGFLVFQLYALASSGYYSFMSYNLLNEPSWIGLKNYIKIFTRDREFYQSLKVTLLYVVGTVPPKIAFALFIAVVLNMNVKGISIFRTIYYLPSILGGGVALSVIWRYLFEINGSINQMLSFIGIKGVNWLGDPKYALFTIGILPVWQYGSSMVLFLAALKQIPKELYESADVEGATKVRKFFSITLPFISPILLFNIIMQTINAFQNFTAAFVVTAGGPLKSTYLYSIMLYHNAFEFLKMGYASAQSWILFVVLMLLSLVIFKTSSRYTFYND